MNLSNCDVHIVLSYCDTKPMPSMLHATPEKKKTVAKKNTELMQKENKERRKAKLKHFLFLTLQTMAQNFIKCSPISTCLSKFSEVSVYRPLSASAVSADSLSFCHRCR